MNQVKYTPIFATKRLTTDKTVLYPEVCEYILPLHILRSQPNLSVSMILILLEIGQRNLKHSMFESFRSNLFEIETNNHSSELIYKLFKQQIHDRGFDKPK